MVEVLPADRRRQWDLPHLVGGRADQRAPRQVARLRKRDLPQLGLHRRRLIKPSPLEQPTFRQLWAAL
jgi:hypothetical protein